MGSLAALFKVEPMRSKPLSSALLLSLALPIAASAGIADFFKSPQKSSAPAAQAAAPAPATQAVADDIKLGDMSLKSLAVAPNDSDLPAWLKDSKRIEQMIGADANFKVENPKVIRRIQSPIPGLDGFVVQATSFSDETPEGKQEVYVFYSDAKRRYLMIGMMIDMEKNRDLNQQIERYVRGELAENPAKALRPQDMHAVVLAGAKNSGSPITFVVDLGPKEGKDSFLNLVRLHQTLFKAGANPRPIRFILVSAGSDEYATAAMAIGYGYEDASKDGVSKLVEFAEKGKSTSWLDSKRMGKDTNIKQKLGIGIFKMEDNSSQALLARLDTLPLLYVGSGDKATNVALPVDVVSWRSLLTQKDKSSP